MSDRSGGEAALDLSRFAIVLRRRWRTIVASVILGTVVAAGMLLFLPPESTSRTLVNVNVISSEPFTADRPASDLLDAETEVQLARSTQVMRSVSEEMGDLTATEVRNATAAQLLRDGTVLLITFTSQDASDAIDGANLVASAYLDYRSELAQQRVQGSVDQLESRRDALTEQLARVRRDLAGSNSDSARAGLESELSNISASLGAVNSRLSDLDALDTTGGTVLTTADAGTTSTSPSTVTLLATGLVGGGVLGIMLAFVVNALDRRVWDRHDVALAGGGQLLVSYHGTNATLPSQGPDADSARSLRERLVTWGSGDSRVLLVIDVSGEPSGVAVDLAAASAGVGHEAELVLLEQPHDFVEMVDTSLALVPAPSAGAMRRFVTGAGRAPFAVTIDEAAGRGAGDDEMIKLLRADRMGSPRLTVVALTGTASASTRLAVAKMADDVVLVVRRRESSIKDISAVRGDLASVDVSARGHVLLPAGRRLALPARSASRPGVHAARDSRSHRGDRRREGSAGGASQTTKR